MARGWGDTICEHCWWDLHRLYDRFSRRHYWWCPNCRKETRNA